MIAEQLSSQPILDAELLRAFVAFADRLNFTHAAADVGLSQPAVFDRVKRLADHLGCPLYTRVGRTIALTPQGERTAAFARDMLDQARHHRGELAGTTVPAVRLAAGRGAFLYLLGPALSAFDGDLELITLGGPSAAHAVQTGAAHLAVGVYDVVPDNLSARAICTTPLCAAVRSDHPLAHRATVTLADLAAHRLVLAPEGQRHRDLVSRAVASTGSPTPPPITADGWPLMLAFAAAGLGVAVVNGTCRAPDGVVFRPIPELGTLTYSLIARRDAPTHPGQHRLARLILGASKRSG